MSPVAQGAVRWVDGRSLAVEGRAFAADGFGRLPVSVSNAVPERVWRRGLDSSGFSFRFATDSSSLRFRWSLGKEKLSMGHMPAAGVSGLDVYRRAPGCAWEHVAMGVPTNQTTNLLSVPWRKGDECLVYAPLYNALASLEVGVDAGAKVERTASRRVKPIVFYGTSITQGCAASRPGLAYVNAVGRLLDAPVVNLGFSSEGKMEPVFADLLAGIDAAVYVVDAVWNVTPAEFEARLEPFVRRLKARRPSVPVILSAAPVDRSSATDAETEGARTKNRLLAEIASRLAGEFGDVIRLGDYPGYADAGTTVDGIHPNDRGHAVLAKAFADVLRSTIAGDRPLNDGWEFRRGTGSWRPVSLPHDWAVEAGFLTNVCARQGDLPYVGEGIYRRRFRYNPDGFGFVPAKVALEVEGAMCESEVWLNGRKVGGRAYGYTTYRTDLTDVLRADNELEIRVRNLPESARWYPGAGLYRNVRIVALPAEHLVPDSLFIRACDVSERSAKVVVDFDWTGGHSNFTFTVEKPRLWSPETPELYELTLFGRSYRYGIREARFDPERGFFLNGRHRQMKGVCLHHDLGPFGAAFVKDAARRQLTLLKEIGCDAVRTSHNPPAPGLLDLCDELGFLVMDEAFDMWERGKTPGDYARHFKAWHERDLTALVRRDRNHPSVVMWSVGNETIEHGECPATDGIRIGTELVSIVRREDPTRPVTFGNWRPEALTNGMELVGDAFGANYLPQHYSAFLARRLGRGIVGTETCSTVSSRGFYKFPLTPSDDKAGLRGAMGDGQVSGYDLWFPHGNDCPPDVEFAAQEKNPAVYGEFVWTGFDYLGEPDPWCGAGRSSYFGIFDLAGFRKDRAWLYQAQWRPDVPVAHLLPHWTWPGREGEVTPVHVYTSGDEAELFVNGVSQGRKRRGRYDYRLRWDDVRYRPGELRVVAYRDGHVWAEESVRTARATARIVRETRRFGEYEFVTFKAVDGDGNLVPTAADRIDCSSETGLVALCNGDPTDRDPFNGKSMRLFNGLLLGVFRR